MWFNDSPWPQVKNSGSSSLQLLLCLIQLWCPFIEAAVLQINFMLYVNVRYFNYISFILAPRCLSPLIYGLRDEKFSHALKNFVFCRLYNKQFDWYCNSWRYYNYMTVLSDEYPTLFASFLFAISLLFSFLSCHCFEWFHFSIHLCLCLWNSLCFLHVIILT